MKIMRKLLRKLVILSFPQTHLPIVIAIVSGLEFVVNEEARGDGAGDVDHFHGGVVDGDKAREEIEITSQEDDSV